MKSKEEYLHRNAVLAILRLGSVVDVADDDVAVVVGHQRIDQRC